MKKLNVFYVVLTLAFVLFSLPLKAQIKQVDFIMGGINDAKPLFESYLRPYANSFGASMNAGWYNTAKPHKLGGFDVTVTFNASWAPKMDRTFDLSALALEGVVTGDPVSPTIAGKKTDARPSLTYFAEYEGNTLELVKYKVPDGTGINMVPVPMAQVGIGLPWGTELDVRFLPTINLRDAGNIGLWGVGGKHDISQHIPLFKRIPVIDISAQGGFTKMTTFANVNFPPTELVLPQNNLTTEPSLFDDQNIEFTANAWTINLVASQTLPVITFYEGIGYSTSVVQFGLKGNYPMVSLATAGPHAGEVVVTDNDILTDPEELQFEMQNTKDLRLNVGFRLKLGVVTIHFDYTHANYSVITSGLGISFR